MQPEVQFLMRGSFIILQEKSCGLDFAGRPSLSWDARHALGCGVGRGGSWTVPWQ